MEDKIKELFLYEVKQLNVFDFLDGLPKIFEANYTNNQSDCYSLFFKVEAFGNYTRSGDGVDEPILYDLKDIDVYFENFNVDGVDIVEDDVREILLDY